MTVMPFLLLPASAAVCPSIHRTCNLPNGACLLVMLVAPYLVRAQVQKYMFIHIRDKKTGMFHTVPMAEQFSAACGDISWIKESEWDGEERLVLDLVN
ncbi:hypothetical protein TSOC_009474 [Tetrabaena socialis]|uniref:Uncharacterized protein n=1 Tax=Tetrabaena socialis TaxID=47790 RepID=A0A2J7ZVR2_9CHLO|nr:hypothetical protein TSOC_009474 [Tetrabaena socialis]|eukprot:PNH04361.1 hypothetical protein TSOC_009474 [Tetrabaena socialis]